MVLSLRVASNLPRWKTSEQTFHEWEASATFLEERRTREKPCLFRVHTIPFLVPESRRESAVPVPE